MGTDFYKPKTEPYFLTIKCERLFFEKNYNNFILMCNKIVSLETIDR